VFLVIKIEQMPEISAFCISPFTVKKNLQLLFSSEFDKKFLPKIVLFSIFYWFFPSFWA
jgi:hypothetical protein